jgi:hypothetical protein
MECELLISNIQNAKTIDLVNENIGHISARALKLGLKRAFDKRPPVARVRCANYGCKMHSDPLTYSSMASPDYDNCRMCHNSFQCSCCGSYANYYAGRCNRSGRIYINGPSKCE